MAVKGKVTSIPSPKRIEYRLQKSEHIRAYDIDNQYPQRVEDIINDSKTAISCLRFRERFIMGGGFTDQSFYKAKVNRKGLTTDKLLRLCSKDVAKYETVALQIHYNAAFEKVEVNFIPWSNCRYSESENKLYDNKVAIHHDWAGVKKKPTLKEIQFVDFYNPDPAVIQAQVDALTTYDKEGNVLVDGWDVYKGQIFIHTPNPREYALFYGDVALEYMQTEGEMKRFNYKSVKNNFLASQFIIVGEEEQELDENGKPKGQQSTFDNDLKEFQGGDGTGRMFIVEKKFKDDIFEVVKADIQDYDGLYEYTDKQCKDSIREVFNIPDALFVAQQNKLSSTSEIDEAVSLYNGNTADERLIIEEVFTEVFNNWYYNINPSGDFTVIPYKYPKSSKQIAPEYFQYYTANEIREGNGDAPLVEQGANDKLLAEKLGVGGTQSLTAILVDPLLNSDQKLGTLKILFSLTDDQAKEMLGINNSIV